jgi:hypothetical protein
MPEIALGDGLPVTYRDKDSTPSEARYTVRVPGGSFTIKVNWDEGRPSIIFLGMDNRRMDPKALVNLMNTCITDSARRRHKTAA